MQLKNPFTIDTRMLYMGVWYCWLCHGNGNEKGGLQLHHILGRVSDSPLNSSLLCGYCHAKMNHNEDEERQLFYLTMVFLRKIKYQLTSKDMYFMEDNKQRLFGPELNLWLENL